MTSSVFGFDFVRGGDEPRPVVRSDLSVVGIVMPSDDADENTFPLNVPVNFNSNDAAYLQDLGTGPLYRTVVAINAQLGPLQLAARIVAVRVAEGADIDETILNIRGNQAGYTGMFALLKAGEMLAVVPRLIGFGKYTGRMLREAANVAVTRAPKPGGNTGNGLMTLAGTPYVTGVQNGGYTVRCIGGALGATSAAKAGGNTGNGALGSLSADAGAKKGVWKVTCVETGVDGGKFSVQDPDGIVVAGLATVGVAFGSGNTGINFTAGDGSVDYVLGDAFNVTVTDVVPANGGVFEVKDPNGVVLGNATVGVAFSNQIAFTIGDGSTDYVVNDQFNVTVVITGGQALANPIVASLPSVLNALMAHAVVTGPGTTPQDAIDFRETINSQRVIVVDGDVKVLDGSEVVIEDLASHVLGIAVRQDFAHGGVPSHSWANQPVHGILGPERYDAFSLLDGATIGQVLLSHNIGVLARGDLSVETAIDSAGFKFVGTDNAGTDPLWQFYNVTRMRDYIELASIRAMRQRLGTSNINAHTVQALKNDMGSFLSDLRANGHILGYVIGFDKDKNNPENIRAGKLRISLNAEEASVLRHITVDSGRYRGAVEEMLNTIAERNNTVVA